MARIASLLAAVALIGFSKALNISEWQSISSDVGVSDEWAKLRSDNSSADEDFGLAYAGDKLYLVSRSEGSAVLGGIVSTLANGTWKHAQFGKLEEDAKFQDHLFSLADRMFLLTAGEQDGRMVFNKLFHWDDEAAMWNELALDISDKDRVFQKLERGPHKLTSIDVPDQEGKTAYLVSTDHEMAASDAETSFSKLDVMVDESGKPLNATIKPIIRIKGQVGKAMISSALKDNRVYGLVATFDEAGFGKISVDVSLNLTDDKARVDGIEIYNATATPVVDYAVGKDRIFQAKDMVLFLGPHEVVDEDKIRRHIWAFDLDRQQYQDADAIFPNLPNRAYALDQKNMRLVTAGLKKGALAATISA